MEAVNALPFILLGLLINSVIATSFLIFVPLDTDVYRYKSIRYFRAYFVLSSTAYVALALRDMMPELLSIFFSNALVLSASYCVVFAAYWRYRLMVYLRQHPAMLHIILFSLLQVAQAHYFPEHAQVRLILVYVNVTAVLIYSLIVFSRHGERERQNERILIFGVSVAAFAVFLVPLSYFASPSFDVFLVLLLLLQNTITLMLFGTFLSTILYDYIFLYQRRAGQDSLTGAVNRMRLAEILAQQQQDGPSKRGAFVTVAIDKLFAINREHDEKLGDEVLRFVFKLLQGVAHAGDIISRTSGNEFSVFLPNADKDNARHIAEKLRSGFEKNIQLHLGQPMTCSFSIGISEKQAEETLSQAWQRSLNALHIAKREGGNRIEYASV